MCTDDTTRLIPARKSDAHLVEHLLSLASALNTELLQDAGFEPPYDGRICLDCDQPTCDDGEAYCSAHMPEHYDANPDYRQEEKDDDRFDRWWAARKDRRAESES